MHQLAFTGRQSATRRPTRSRPNKSLKYLGEGRREGSGHAALIQLRPGIGLGIGDEAKYSVMRPLIMKFQAIPV